MPESKRGKRRRGSQAARTSSPSPSTKPKPPSGGNANSSIPGLPWLAGGAIVLAILVVAFILIRPFGGVRQGRRGCS